MHTGLSLTGAELHDLQRRALHHVALSITEACPLKCAHCAVESRNARARRVSLTRPQARSLAAELPALRDASVNHLTLTGGEPLVRPDLVQILESGAHSAGINCSVVTGCHWAATAESTSKVVRSFSHIQTWHLSCDVFHLPQVPAEAVIRAADALVNAGRRVVVRMTFDPDREDAHRALRDTLRGRLPERVPVVVQALLPSESDAPSNGLGTPGPCMPSGMLVRPNLSVAPCCSALAHFPGPIFFGTPSVREVGLVGAYHWWRNDPLLQLLRAVGIAPLIRWAVEEFPGLPALRNLSSSPCSSCVGLWKEAGVAERLRTRALRPENREKLRRLLDAIWNAPAGDAQAPPRSLSHQQARTCEVRHV